MSEHQVFWYVARTSGLLAYGLLFMTVVLGLRVRTRALKDVGVGWGAIDLHRVAGTAGLVAIAVHLAALALDSYMPFGGAELFVPFASSYRPLPTALGIVALYLMLAVIGTSLMRARLPLRLWRALHLLSYAAFALALFHGLGAGTDAAQPWARPAYWLSGSIVAALYFARLFDPFAMPSRAARAVRP